MRRQILTVARHEWTDSVRSRRTLVVLVLYVAVSLAATAIFVTLLRSIEREFMRALGLKPAAGTGGVTVTVWQSDAFKRVVGDLVRDRDLANALLGMPPLALFFGWLSFTFGPLLVLLTAAGRIAEEVASGSARFVLFRCPRLAWTLGKFGGQALLILCGLVLSAATVTVFGWLRLESCDPAATVFAIFGLALKVWVYCLPFLGLALGISQVTRSPHLATALSFLALMGLGIGGHVAEQNAAGGWARLWTLAAQLLPFSHQPDLWRQDWAHVLPAAVVLMGLAGAYLLAGYACLRRRDV